VAEVLLSRVYEGEGGGCCGVGGGCRVCATHDSLNLLKRTKRLFARELTEYQGPPTADERMWVVGVVMMMMVVVVVMMMVMMMMMIMMRHARLTQSAEADEEAVCTRPTGVPGPAHSGGEDVGGVGVVMMIRRRRRRKRMMMMTRMRMMMTENKVVVMMMMMMMMTMLLLLMMIMTVPRQVASTRRGVHERDGGHGDPAPPSGERRGCIVRMMMTRMVMVMVMMRGRVVTGAVVVVPCSI
jgi:hypothetical protein